MDILRLLGILLRPLDDLMDLASRIPTWSRQEALEFLRQFKRAALQAILIPFIILVAAALLGGEVPLLKRILVYIGSFLAAWFAIIIAWRSLPMAVILAALLEVASHGFEFYRRLADRFEKAAEFYVKLVGLVLANELWIGMFVLITPIHNRPEALVPVLLLTGIILSWTMWKGGVEWWPRVIYMSSLILLLLFIASFWFPNTAAKVQAFEPERWLEQTLEKREQEKKRREQASAPGMEVPQARELPDGTIEMGLGARFMLGAGTERTFSFGPMGAVITGGKKYTVVCDVPCTERDGQVKRELERDVTEWIRRYGDKPCYTESDPFRMKLRADPSADLFLRARTASDPPCHA